MYPWWFYEIICIAIRMYNMLEMGRENQIATIYTHYELRLKRIWYFGNSQETKYWNQGCGRETLISCDEGDLLHAGRRGCFFFPWKSFHRILSGRWQCLDAQWLALPLFREVHWFPDIWMHDSTSTLLIYCFIWNANLGVFCIYWFLQEENKTTHQFLCDK